MLFKKDDKVPVVFQDKHYFSLTKHCHSWLQFTGQFILFLMQSCQKLLVCPRLQKQEMYPDIIIQSFSFLPSFCLCKAKLKAIDISKKSWAAHKSVCLVGARKGSASPVNYVRFNSIRHWYINIFDFIRYWYIII